MKLIEIRTPDYTDVYELTEGDFIEVARHSSPGTQYIPRENLSVGQDYFEEASVVVSSSGRYVGHFKDEEAFLSFVKNYLRGEVVTVVEE